MPVVRTLARWGTAAVAVVAVAAAVGKLVPEELPQPYCDEQGAQPGVAAAEAVEERMMQLCFVAAARRVVAESSGPVQAQEIARNLVDKAPGSYLHMRIAAAEDFDYIAPSGEAAQILACFGPGKIAVAAVLVLAMTVVHAAVGTGDFAAEEREPKEPAMAPAHMTEQG